MFPCGFGDQAWLIQTPGSDKETQTFINPWKPSIEERKILEMEGQLCLARFEEWLFLVSDECFLLNIYSLAKVHLPPIEEPFAYLGLRILTSSPTSLDCTVIFFGREENFLLFCRPGDEEWTKLAVDFNVTEVEKMLVYKGKVYTILLNKIKIIDVASLSTNHIDTDSIDKPDFFCYGIGHASHLVESCGDLFYVRVCYPGIPRTTTFNDFEICKFSNEDKSWERVESIGDHAFFLDRHGGQSRRAHEARVDRDCIYLIESCYDGERLYKICLHDQTISFHCLPEDAIQGNLTFFWVLPLRRQTIIKPDPLTSCTTIASSEVCQKGSQPQQYGNKENVTLSLANLPMDMMQLISERVSLNDSSRLRAVCKQWAELPNPIKEERVWLMYCPKKHGTCRMYNPSQGKECVLNSKSLSSEEPTRLLFSKYGWILALEGHDQLCLLNPFTNNYHPLPILEYCYSYNGIAFSSPPNSSSCVVFAIGGPPRGEFTSIISWHFGKEELLETEFDNEYPFYVAENNPVFINGEFYCLGKIGNLGVFNPENNTWRVLRKPLPIYSEASQFGKQYCYLLEFNGEIISVFQAVNMDYIHVYKFDRSKMDWIPIEELGDMTLFLDHRSSIARASTSKSNRNKFYLPWYHNETNKTAFYYSIKTKMMNYPNLKNLRRPYNCVWLEPNLGN